METDELNHGIANPSSTSQILSKSYETFVIRPSTAGYVQPSDRITVKVFVRDGAQFTGTEAFKVSVMGLSEDLQRKVKESQNLSTLFKVRSLQLVLSW